MRRESGSPVNGGSARRRVRRTAAIAAASLARSAVRLVRHGGTSLPGMLAERIDPTVVGALAADLGCTVFVIGTNGKTTTSRLIARLLTSIAGQPPLANRSGANLKQGIASSLILEASWAGRLHDPGRSAVFEVDELALGGIVRTVTPDIIVILNLFRDQLDRFGEVETVIDRWRAVLSELPADTVIVSCADDPRIETLVAGSGLRVVRFGLAGPSPAPAGALAAGTDSDVTTADPVACPVCNAPLSFAWRSLAHLGSWACPAGHVRRVAPDVVVRTIEADAGGSSVVEFEGTFGRLRSSIHLSGTGVAYDAAAAVAAAEVAGLKPAQAVAALDGATPAFGRFEEARHGGRRIVLALAKNPASLTESAHVAAALHPEGVLLGLSDEPADGTDVSWIWDVDFEVLRAVPAMGLMGTRRDDLAVRLKYALDGHGGRWPIVVRAAAPELALQQMLDSIRPGGTLVIIATYTSMLAARSALERLGAVAPMPR